MRFTVLIPARRASTRLPDKPLADIAGKPMVVRVAERVAASGAARTDHASGSDRLAEACAHLELDGDDIVVNVQGDEPLLEPALVRRCAELLDERRDCVVSTAAHPIDDASDYRDPNVVKVVLDGAGRALYFSRAPIPHWRDGGGAPPADHAPLRHLGIYCYRAGFLRRFPLLAASPLERVEALEQLRVLWHGERIAVHVAHGAPGEGHGPGVDTPQDLARVRAWFARHGSG